MKEILDMFTKYKDDWYSCEYKLKPKQCVILYDYITNLKQENKRLNNIINKAVEYIKCGITGDLENDRAYVDENALLDILQGSDKE